MIGLLVIVGGLGGQVLDAFARFALLDAAGPATPNPILTSATLDLTWAVTGLMVLALSILKNNHARAIRFTTLTALCDALDCQPGDLFSVTPTQHP